MTGEKWITYFKAHHSTGHEIKATKLEGERISLRSSWQMRPATDEEIAEEKSRREQKKREDGEREAFELRRDYIAAMAIRNILEWMNPDSHPLDALTVEEWEDLQRKLAE